MEGKLRIWDVLLLLCCVGGKQQYGGDDNNKRLSHSSFRHELDDGNQSRLILQSFALIDGQDKIRRLGTSQNIITTFAGGGSGGDGSAATSASLNFPYGVALGSAGHIYIADSNGYKIRLVTSSGIISTFAGGGNLGTSGSSGDGGAATSAQLGFVYGVGADYYGPKVYIADGGNNKIRLVTSSGIITTFAGTGVSGNAGDGGAAASAQLNSPYGVAVDSFGGKVYIADTGNNKVRLVNSNGIISTFAGTGVSGNSGDGGAATSAQLNYVYGVASDINAGPTYGNVYIADSSNNKIRLVTSSGIITTFAGTGVSGNAGDGGAATSAQLFYPTGVAVDGDGNVYIVDWGNFKIRWVNSAGIIALFAGAGYGSSGDGGAASSAQLSGPYGVAADFLTGNIYIADTGNNKIRVVKPVIPVCSAGSYLSGSTCVSCLAGTYNPNVGATSSSACVSCAAGTYSSTIGATSSSACVACPSGTYNPTVGATSISACVACAAGTYNSLVGQSSSSSACWACAQGTWSSTVGATSISACVACTAGTYNPTSGATSQAACVQCVSGTYNPITGGTSSSSCFACLSGTYALSGSTTCTACLSGSSSLSSASSCTQCSAGTYAPNAGSFSCSSCASGSFSPSNGLSSCTPCSGGYYASSIGSSICTICSGSGVYSAAGAAVCSQCPAGSVPASGLASCLQCSAGTYATYGSATCTSCASGYYATASSSSCLACPANTYLASPGGTSISSCVACTPPAISLSGSSQCYSIPPTPAPTVATIAPTLVPSVEPSQEPTFPTGGQVQAVAVLYVKQTITGITETGAKTVSFQNAFFAAVANVFSVPVTAISSYTVTSLSRRSLLASGVAVSYTLTVNNANPNTVASQLSSSTTSVQTQLATNYAGVVLVNPAVSLTTMAPTATPTVATMVPSWSPSTLATVATVYVVQTFSGLSVATASSSTFQSTFALLVATQDGTTSAQVQIGVITATNRRKLLLAGVNIAYTVAASNTSPTLLTATINNNAAALGQSLTSSGYPTTVISTSVTTTPSTVAPSASPASASTLSVLGTGGVISVAVGGACLLFGLLLLVLYSTKWKCACPTSCGECWKWTRYGKPAHQSSSRTLNTAHGEFMTIEATVIESSVTDRVFLSRPLGEAFSSSGYSKIAPGDFVRANNTTTKTPAILKMSTDEEKVMREFGFMTKLHGQFSEQFVEPYGLLRGVDNQIIPHDDNESYECSQFVVIAMEKGEMDMKTYLHENKWMPDTEKLMEVQKLLQIIEAASSAKIVLVDFKPENIVRVQKAGKIYLKAIDFECACDEGTDMLGEMTPSYGCPEFALSMVGQPTAPVPKNAPVASGFSFWPLAVPNGPPSSIAAQSRPRPKASHKMDVMAFGWIVFEIANDMIPYWQTQESGIVQPATDEKIMDALANLTDERIATTLESVFPEEKQQPLRSFLQDALRVNPQARFTAERLRTERSLLGIRSRTINVDRITQSMEAGFSSVHKHIDELSAQLTGSLQDVGTQLEAIAERGSDQEMSCIADAIQVHKQYLQTSKLTADPVHLASTMSRATASFGPQVSQSLSQYTNAVMSETTGPSSDEKLNAMLEAIADMREQMRGLGELSTAQYHLVAELERRGNVMPHTFVIIPELRDEIPGNASKATKLKNYILRKSDIITGLLWERSRLHFFCPLTRKRVPCGPDGKGYSISLPSKLLKALLPAMKIGLIFLKLALASQGLGGMVPDFNTGQSPFPGQAEMESMVQVMSKEFSSLDATMTGDASNFASMTEKLADWENSAEEKVKGAYSTIFQLVAQSEGYPNGVSDRSWKPTMTGLILTTAPAGQGKSLWVSSEGRPAFQKTGWATIRNQGSNAQVHPMGSGWGLGLF